MLPRWHILLGGIFTFIFWIFAPETEYFYLSLIFLASFLIDFDHYISSVIKTRKIGLFESFEYHRKKGIEQRREKEKGIKRKGDFHFFHTLEFHALIGIMGLFWMPLFYVFIGMAFHSLMDIFSLSYEGYLYRREYFFFNWALNKTNYSLR